ncbi:MAG TPA: ABC transporter ATP-binding protein [Vicinamibacterales bacterium]
MTPLLEIDRLAVGFPAHGRMLPVVHDVSLSIGERETLCLVGESGSGKSLTALAAMRLVPSPGRTLRGSIRLRGRELLTISEEDMCAVRGAEIGMVFQEPSAALNPVLTIGDQIAEPLVIHGRAGRREARAEAVRLLEAVKMPDAAARARDYPHQLSGGQRQRALIAAALACRPALLIADEPTTALDARIQAEVLDLLRELQAQYGLALLLVTHDLGVVARMADRVAVMYAGRIVEQGSVRRLFTSPAHPYTRGLLASMPGTGKGRLAAIDGTVPDPASMPPGCAFEPRCAERLPVCREAVPDLTSIDGDQASRCVHAGGRAH